MAASFPTQARVVIVGGGIMGCSTAYHLAKLGWKDVVLLEQGRLSGGTTWHAAGLVGQLRSYQNLTRLIRYSTELYSKLEAETGLATGWKQCGSLSVARTEERMVLLRRSAAMANAQGVACEPLTPKQAGEKYPIMRTDDLVGAVWLPGDGKANPADITQALAKGARNGGVRIFEKVRVTDVDIKDGRVTGVQTTEGPITAEIVVNCAGQWARQLGRKVGVTVPLYSCEHMYIVTEKMEGVPRDLPVMRDPDGYIYFKEEVGGLLMGGFEPEAKPWNKDIIPDDFEFGMLPDDWDQFQILMDNALIRVPSLEKTGIKTFMNGPESFTPDNNYILGEAHRSSEEFLSSVPASIRWASPRSGGAGMALAEWIVATASRPWTCGRSISGASPASTARMPG
jgi:sarcosine dehydrogenase